MKEAEPIWDAPLAERLGAADALLLVSRLEVVTVYDGKPPSQREPAESCAASPAHGAWAESWLLQ
jgi:hypothetical protein